MQIQNLKNLVYNVRPFKVIGQRDERTNNRTHNKRTNKKTNERTNERTNEDGLAQKFREVFD